MYVDSHCHLNFPELKQDLPNILDRMKSQAVTHALVVSVDLPHWPSLVELVNAHPNLWASVGVHPEDEAASTNPAHEPSVEKLVALAQSPKVVAIGETGLDYSRLPESSIRQDDSFERQRTRFRRHIRAACQAGLPLIVHTRAAAEDTLSILREENAATVGGVMHCFTETWEVAQAAIDLNFYISLSGIVTFKNAKALQELAKNLPLEHLLIETDSPYLAPVPHRGTLNEPAYVVHVAEKIAALKGVEVSTVASFSTHNFFNLFKKIDKTINLSHLK